MKKETLRYGILFGVGYIIFKWTVLGLAGTWLYRNGHWSNWYLLIFPTIGLTNLYIRSKKKSKKGFRKFFYDVMEQRFSENHQDWMRQTEAHFEKLLPDISFLKRSRNPIDKRLVFSAYFLALIQTLEKQGKNFQEIREICLEITHAYVTPHSSFKRWLKKLPPKLIHLKAAQSLLILFNKKVSQGEPEGFRARIILDKEQTYGFGYGVDILECGICKLFNKHDAGIYATILCEVDKLTSGLAGLELIRNSTIAHGAPICDFRFRRLKN